MSIRVVPGEISAKDTTTRTVIPTAAQPRWPPFERVAERIASSGHRFPPHHHAGVEVLTYVVEGSGSYEFGPGPPDALVAGSTHLLTAPEPVAHAIRLEKGQTIRWFALVATLPPRSPTPLRLQSARAVVSGVRDDVTHVQPIIGAGTPIASAVGMEAEVVEFHGSGASFRKLGHDRVAVGYALSGRGAVDNEAVDGGEAALVEGAAGVALHGRPGFRVILVSAPRRI
ncbi:MAG: pirin family protein [Thermoplasmata archaeon]|nr:pirin family protein [Thermoplasmata archaeon]